MIFKAVILVSCLSGLVLAYNDQTDLTHKCEEEQGIDSDVWHRFNATRPVHTDDNRIKCFLRCVLIGIEWMDEGGKFTKKAPNGPLEEEFYPFVENCSSSTGLDPCDQAYNFHKCLVEHKEA